MSLDSDNLPWYLKESIGGDDQGGGDTHFVRYVGKSDNDGDSDSSSIHMNIQTKSRDSDGSSSVNNNRLYSSAVGTADDEVDLPRRRKRATGRMEYESNPNFVPFTGSLDDLIQSSKPLEVTVSSSASTSPTGERNSWLERAVVVGGAWWRINTAMSVVCVTFFILQKRLKTLQGEKRKHLSPCTFTSACPVQVKDGSGTEKNKMTGHGKKAVDGDDSDDGDPPDVVNLDTHTFSMSNDEDRCVFINKSREEDSNPDICNEPIDDGDDHQGENKVNDAIIPTSSDQNIGKDPVVHEKKIVYASSAHSNDDINDMVLRGIPAMAEILSKSGLNSQDSLRIATQEYLTTRRLSTEEARKIQKEKITEMDAKLEEEEASAGHWTLTFFLHEAATKLHDSAISMTVGFQFIICVVTSCAFRLLSSNSQGVIKILFGEDNAMVQIEEMAYKWIVRDMCGCLVNADPDPPIISNIPSTSTSTSVSSILTNIAVYALHFSGITIAPSIPISIPVIGSLSQCALTYFLFFLLIALAHRILRIFHSNMLHNAFNWTVLIYWMVKKTVVGRSIIVLLLEIFVYNATLCGVGLCLTRRGNTNDNDDRERSTCTTPENLKEGNFQLEASVKIRQEKLRLTEDTRQKMLMGSWAGAIFLGVAPVVILPS